MSTNLRENNGQNCLFLTVNLLFSSDHSGSELCHCALRIHKLKTRLSESYAEDGEQANQIVEPNRCHWLILV